MSVRVNITAVVSSGQFESLCQFIKENIDRVRHFEGCLYVGVFFDEGNKTLLLEEEWQNVAAHQSYIEHIKASGVLQQLVSYFDSEPTISYYHKHSI